jgi:hypothetical protein
MKRMLIPGIAIVASAGLSGCVVSQIHISDDFGAAARQNVVAQIAEPDRRYLGPPPPSNGARAVLAQVRYRHGLTIPPVATASDVGVEGAAGAPPPPPAAGGASAPGP